MKDGTTQAVTILYNMQLTLQAQKELWKLSCENGGYLSRYNKGLITRIINKIDKTLKHHIFKSKINFKARKDLLEVNSKVFLGLEEHYKKIFKDKIDYNLIRNNFDFFIMLDTLKVFGKQEFINLTLRKYLKDILKISDEYLSFWLNDIEDYREYIDFS